jgi:hypothetical protein
MVAILFCFTLVTNKRLITKCTKTNIPKTTQEIIKSFPLGLYTKLNSINRQRNKAATNKTALINIILISFFIDVQLL